MTLKPVLIAGLGLVLFVASVVTQAGNAASLGFATRLNASVETHRVDSMVITRVTAGSPADKAGIRTGDELLDIDDVSVHGASVDDLWQKKQSIRHRDRVHLRVKHIDGSVEAVEIRASAADVL